MLVPPYDQIEEFRNDVVGEGIFGLPRLSFEAILMQD